MKSVNAKEITRRIDKDGGKKLTYTHFCSAFLSGELLFRELMSSELLFRKLMSSELLISSR